MKKLFTLVSMILTTAIVFGQSQRMVLTEEFTQASCPPCASQNPAFNALLLANAAKTVSVKYQVWWPGYDPMYLQNTADVGTRVSYYGVSGVPYGLTDGNEIASCAGSYAGAPYCLHQTDIDNAYAIPSPMDITLTHNFSPDYDSVYVTMHIAATQAFGGTLKARIAVVEKLISFNTPPGANGETDFYSVMKKMLPSASGTTLPASFNNGDTYDISLGWKLANIYDYKELAVVGWVQDDADKSVLQAAISEPLPVNSFATVTAISNSTITCSGTITPTVTLSNGGINSITNADISYKIDNGTASTYNWTGTLSAGNNTTVILPAVTVPVGGHTFNAWVSAVEGNPFNSGSINNPVTQMNGVGTPANTPVLEGFVNSTFPPPGWIVTNPDGGSTWIRNTLTGGFQNSMNCTKYPFHTVAGGAIDELYVQNFDLSNTSETQAFFEFAYAKAKYDGRVDRLEVKVSHDCGTSWTSLFNKTDNSGLSTATSTTEWKPTSASEWLRVQLDMSSLIGYNNVIVKFVASSGNGNNLYVDDINMHYGPAIVGINAPVSPIGIQMFPNPANETVTLQLDGNLSDKTYAVLTNSIGQVVKNVSVTSFETQMDVRDLSNGIYICKIIDNGKVLGQQKLDIVR